MMMMMCTTDIASDAAADNTNNIADDTVSNPATKGCISVFP